MRAGWHSVAAVPLLIAATPDPGPRLAAIDRVWAGHRAGFALAVDARRIVVAYYDANRQLTIASRPRDADWWTYARVDSWTNWDSHNGIALAIDSAGRIHLSGNKHNDPLVYYRTREAGDVRTFERIATLGQPGRERQVTYPVFLRDAHGGLLFKYRDGGSGHGDEVLVRYDAAGARWSPLLSTPLIDGEGRRNAYPVGPVAGPDGRFHLVWVWRDTPDAATNHDLSYASSIDLVNWARVDGAPSTLPVRLATAGIVDPVPVRGGIINNNTMIGFDAAGRVVIAYHKFDARGQTQVFVARAEQGRWRIAQASRWTGFRWDIGGGGSIDSRLTLSPPRVVDGRLRVGVVRDGRATDLLLDPVTLAPLGEVPVQWLADRLAAHIAVPAGMTLATVEDAATGIAIAWPTRPADRDRAPMDIAPPQVLRLVMPAGG